MADREFDVVLFGATGFVGALTAAHLATAAGSGVWVGLAARSRARLESVRPARFSFTGSADPLPAERRRARWLEAVARARHQPTVPAEHREHSLL